MAFSILEETIMGLLIISGTLRVKQFWPEGRSDADTVTVELVPPAKKPFVFVNDAGKRQTTHAFDNAAIEGKFGQNPVIKGSVVRKVTVRLQGVDAPELHYQPTVPGTKGKGLIHPFRQSLGETCADALHDFVASFGQAEVPCVVTTAVSRPNDVCDVFGRVVGNVVLVIGGSRIDINDWLLREGWVMPGLYNSMSKAEIAAVLAGHAVAKQEKRGLLSKNVVTTKLAPFDPKQLERKGPASFKPFSDKGPVNFPKFFRRQAEHHVHIAHGESVPADLRGFIKTKKDDVSLSTTEFLKLKGSVTGKKPRPEFKNLSTFLGGNAFPTGPEIVFWENDSRIVKAGTNTPITKW
jgi:endonuclease YncB( thermonuclease family)